MIAMAALDSTSELNNLLDTWRKEDQENLSPVDTLQRLVVFRCTAKKNIHVSGKIRFSLDVF